MCIIYLWRVCERVCVKEVSAATCKLSQLFCWTVEQQILRSGNTNVWILQNSRLKGGVASWNHVTGRPLPSMRWATSQLYLRGFVCYVLLVRTHGSPWGLCFWCFFWWWRTNIIKIRKKMQFWASLYLIFVNREQTKIIFVTEKQLRQATSSLHPDASIADE